MLGPSVIEEAYPRLVSLKFANDRAESAPDSAPFAVLVDSPSMNVAPAALKNPATQAYHVARLLGGLLLAAASFWLMHPDRGTIETIARFPFLVLGVAGLLSATALLLHVIAAFRFATHRRWRLLPVALLQLPAGWFALLALMLCLTRIPFTMHATQMTPALVERSDDGQWVTIKGQLDPLLLFRLQRALQDSQACALRLESSGGSVHVAMHIAALVQRRDCQVSVAARCASACVTTWAAARRRETAPEALFGFHSVGADGSSTRMFNPRLRRQLAAPSMEVLRAAGIPELFVCRLIDGRRKVLWVKGRDMQHFVDTFERRGRVPARC